MTDDLRFERLARDWLELGPFEAPPDVVQAAFVEIDTTPQERDLRVPWRFESMTRFAFMGAAAAVLIAAVLGGLYLGARQSDPGIGGPGSPSPTVAPTPTTEPSPTPAPTPSPTVEPSPSIGTISLDDTGKTLEAGRYQVSSFAAPFSVTLPAGWGTNGFTPNSVSLASLADESLNVYIAVIDKVYGDPCRPGKGATTVAPGVDKLVAALAAMKGFEVADRQDVSIGGASGTSFTISNSINGLSCAKSPMPFATYDKDGKNTDVGIFAGEHDTFWVLDAGGTRLLIAVTDSRVDEVAPILQSLAFGADASN
jgi:hypothetical protein